MSGRLPGPIGYILTMIIGLILWIPAFFVIFFGILANDIRMADSIVVESVPITITYFVLGAIFSFISNFLWSKASSWRWGAWFSIPTFVCIGLLVRTPRFEQINSFEVRLLYTFATTPLAFACLGAYAGMQIALRVKLWKSNAE